MKLIKHFKQLNKEDAAIAGGKGASLGEMTQAGIPVPPGFVILADAFERFIIETSLTAEIDAILEKVDHREMHTVEYASETIQGLILHVEMPVDLKEGIEKAFKDLNTEFVAVRSSATAEDGVEAAWAGQLDTFLNTTKNDLLEKVRECWASLFTPRAIFYRFEKGMNLQKISVAVVVQKMVNSDAAGIAFSVHPVTEDHNQMIIEAGFGLGEAVVSGQVTPDSYIVTKTPRSIIEKSINEQNKALYRKDGGGNEWKELSKKEANSAVLNDAQILALSEVLIGIENHYGFPVDTEWAMENGELFIVQSRPITTLSTQSDVSNYLSSSPTELFGDKNLYFNIGVWTSPTIEWESWLNWLNTDEAKSMGIPHDSHASTIINHNYLFRTDGSYIWIKNKCYNQFKEGKYELAQKILELGDKFGIQCVELSKQIKKDATFTEFEDAYELMKHIRFPWMACFAVSDAAEMILKEYVEQNNESLEDISAAVPQRENSVNEDQKMLYHLGKEIDKSKLGFDFEKIQLHNEHLAEEIKGYQKETEFIGTHHFWGEPRTIDRLMDAITHAADSHETKKKDYPELKELFDVIAWATKVRLECAQNSSQLAYAFRPMLQKIAHSLNLSYEELIFLRISEIKSAIEVGKADKAIIQEREKGYAIFCHDEDVHLAVGKELESYENYFGLKEELPYTEEIKGSIGNKGKVTGTVVIVRIPRDHSKVEKGMILVAPETTPDFIPIMGKAAAFVTDLGGITSHAAIVAREMNKPCVIGTKVATKMLKDGDLVEVDADNGVIRILAKPYTDTVEFNKVYTRDTTIIMQEFWGQTCTEGVAERYGIHNPNRPEIIHFMYEGSIEIWENKAATKFLMDAIYEKNSADENFMPTALNVFKTQIAELKVYWDKDHADSLEEFESYIDKARDALTNFIPYYYSAVDDRTPQHLRDMALEFRNEDFFFANSDTFIRNSLVYLYPEVKGYETAITTHELGNVPGHEELEARRAHMTLIDGIERTTETLTQLQARRPELLFVSDKSEFSGQEIKGQIAHKGLVRGTVRILRRRDQIPMVREGEIIVSPMTTPDFLPAMEKAAAFVTDEGGITCHAGIVAREMQKPCIIGTKIATQVLKDGDEVEVDANNGVIRILKIQINPEYQEIEFIKNTFPLDVYTLELAWSNAAKRTDLNLIALEVILVFKDGNLTLYCDNAAWQENARRAFSALINSSELRDARSIRSQEYISKIQQRIVKIKSGEYASLVEAHTLIQDALHECMLSFSEENFPGLHSSLLTDELHILVPDSELSADLLNAKRQSYFQKYEIALLAIASQIEKENISTPLTFEKLPTSIQKNIEILITTYGWISAGFNEKAKDINVVIAEINELFATGVSIKKIEQDRLDRFTLSMQKKEMAEKKLQENLSDSDWTNVELIQVLIEDAKYRIEFGLELIYVSRIIYEKIAQNYSLSLTEIKYLYPNEITELLEGKFSATEAKIVIDSRRSGEFIVSIKDGMQVELDSFIAPKKEDSVLKGQKAYGGIVRGLVRIVNSPEDNHKIMDGDILVSSRTSPELVPAMAKAGAIVSELGGMLCHAAIVSREMKKTCLVGVKRATELLHDGDFVEVNADTGVIEIIQE